jgi:hypothetical protein
MRKPFILLAFLLQLTVHAAERSLEDAYAIAYRFMSSPAATKSSSVYLKMVYDGTSQSTRSCNTAPAYYVFDNLKAPGFVIVSADDAARTILGYSDSYDFEFENMPPNLQWWLGQMNREVEFIRSSGVYAVSSSATKGTPVKLYETAKWNQYAPYNQECPVISTNGKSSNAVTGCGPTAMAIVMRYRKYPNSGVGQTPQYVTGSYKVTVPSRNLGHYDWEQMPMTYSSSWTSQQKSAVARLMADIGASARVDYGLSSPYDGGTVIMNDDVVPALTGYFSYDKSAMMAMRTHYSDKEWYDLVKQELDMNGPLLYSGQADEGGHLFVLDGYDSEDYFHVNWGWGGQSDGYYALSAMNPNNQGAGSFDGGYNRGQLAFVGLKPDEDGSAPLLLYHYCFENQYDTYRGLYVKEYDSVTGLPKIINVGGIWNMSTFTCREVKVRLVVVDRNMNPVKEMWTRTLPDLAPTYYSYYYNISLTDYGHIEEGYSLISQYYDASCSEWKLIRAGWETQGVDRIVLVPEVPVDRNVSLKYDNATGIISLHTEDELTITCSCDGRMISVISGGNGKYMIQTERTKTAVYSIKFAKDGKEKILKVTAGKKQEEN